METEEKLRLADVFVSITDPRQASKVEHDLVELLVVGTRPPDDTFSLRIWRGTVTTFLTERSHGIVGAGGEPRAVAGGG
jgi:hypothetical protein